MMSPRTSSCSSIVTVMLVTLSLAAFAFPDDEADILALVQKYGDLEDDLEAQAKMMRADRVYINAGVRLTDEAKNMSVQIANRKAAEALNGGETKFVTTIEGPIVKLYGNVAVASFVRMFSVYPHNQQPSQGAPIWVTLVFVKEGGQWGIAHTHQSLAGGNN